MQSDSFASELGGIMWLWAPLLVGLWSSLGPFSPRYKGGRFPGCNGSILGMQGDDFASELGGITEVGMWPCVLLLVGLWYSFYLVSNYCCIGSRQWRWGSSSHAMSSYMEPMDWCKEATLNRIFSVVTTLPCSTIIFNSLKINVRHKCVATSFIISFFSYPY